MNGIFLAFFISFSALASAPDLPLDLTFEESRAFFKTLRFNKFNKSNDFKDQFIESSISGGEKMNNWLNLINQNRSDENILRLTSKGTQRGIPIEKPSKYGPSTIKDNLIKLLDKMPFEMKEIIYGNKSITSSPIISDEDFVKWARVVSYQYQTAVRWTGMLPWLGEYSRRASKDIRGYYYLKNIENLDDYLLNYDSLSIEEIEKLLSAMVGICINSNNSKKLCEKELRNELTNKNGLLKLKNKYWQRAVNTWESFFRISNPRSDITWSRKNPGVLEIPFKEVTDLKVATWLKENVEEEFQSIDHNWKLEMSFKSFGFGMAYLEFQKNVTPHVSGGNKVVMDANTALEEYGVKWTIRHEFGHILRFPDCYHEFYDAEAKLMVNYQLDTTDLMCSRAGQMNDRIYQELKRVYLK